MKLKTKSTKEIKLKVGFFEGALKTDKVLIKYIEKETRQVTNISSKKGYYYKSYPYTLKG